jgi:protein-S-isoprenylcysteine O-methyltransferase Ste14
MILGQFLWYGSPWLAVYAGVVTVGFHLFVVWYEEPHLIRVFGEPYRKYCRRVPRWFPRGTHVLDITAQEAETP